MNGTSCGRLINVSPTHAFQRRLSEAGQRLTPSDESISIVYPREYQWSGHDSAELPTWLDLTSVLDPGVNALCVEVETPGTTPALIVSGEALLATGERIPIRSGPEWQAEPVPNALPQERWTYPESPVLNWNHARVLPWKRNFWRLVPEGVYEEPFRGKRVRFAGTGSITWLEQEVDLSSKPVEGFLRVATDTPFQIWINERPVQPITLCPTTLGCGPWFIREMTRSEMDFALGNLPVWLDADEVATLLPGQQGESPQRRDPRLNNFNPDRQPDGHVLDAVALEGGKDRDEHLRAGGALALGERVLELLALGRREDPGVIVDTGARRRRKGEGEGEKDAEEQPRTSLWAPSRCPAPPRRTPSA